MTYIYAYSNHKVGLSRLRRMAVKYQALQAEGVAVEMLTNDFRAAAAIREYGVTACTTIETVLDIDFVAERGDSLIMDTPEDDRGKLKTYVEMFASVERVAQGCDDASKYGEAVVEVDPLVDNYFYEAKSQPKEARTLLFVGDADAEKWLLSHADTFSAQACELLLGEYFFVGYEEALLEDFPVQHEAESYRTCITNSSRVLSVDIQAAYEASAAGAEVIYIGEPLPPCQQEKMTALGIKLGQKGVNF